MNFFTRGPSQLPEGENPTEFNDEIYYNLLALETVHANYGGMKESLVDAGKVPINNFFSRYCILEGFGLLRRPSKALIPLKI